MKYKIFSSKYFNMKPEPVNEKFEKLDMNMQKGYGYELKAQSEKAIIEWKKVFDEIKAYFADNQLSDIETFDKLFNGNQFVSNWVLDYEEALSNVLIGCNEENKQQIGEQKIELIRFLLDLNMNKELMAYELRRSLAETYYSIGKPEIGEKYFIELIKEYPDYVWGYVGYSDEYWMEYSKYKDYEKAIKILTEAYNRITIEESDIIVDRLTELTIVYKKKELDIYLKKEEKHIIPEDESIETVINKLRSKMEETTFSYLEFLENHKEAALPVILEEMKSYIKNPDDYARENGLLSIYIPFILGQWEVKEASKGITDLIACPDESIELRIGQAITEEYPVVLYKCFDGDLNYIKNLINRKNIGEYSKSAYLATLSMYYIEELEDIEGLKSYLENLLIQQPEMATWISDIVLMHKRQELLTVGEQSVKSKFYDPLLNGKWSEYQFHFNDNFHDETLIYKKPFNAIQALKSRLNSTIDKAPIVPDYDTLFQSLLTSREEKLIKSGKKSKTQYHQQQIVKGEKQQQIVKVEKTGRNEQCTCGSGKKYKKCCGK